MLPRCVSGGENAAKDRLSASKETLTGAAGDHLNQNLHRARGKHPYIKLKRIRLVLGLAHDTAAPPVLTLERSS